MSEGYPLFDFEFDGKQWDSQFWDVDIVKSISFKDKIAAVPSFKRVFSEYHNLTPRILKDMTWKVKGENHVVCEVTGTQGSGKSRSTQAIIKMIKARVPELIFGIEQVYFTYEKILKAAQEHKDFSQPIALLLDDQAQSQGMGAIREKKEMQNLIELCRKARISIFLISVTPRLSGTAYYRFESCQQSHKHRINKLAVKSQQGYGYLGYFLVNIEKDESDKLWQAYIPRKDEFVKQALDRKIDRYNSDEWVSQIAAHPLIHKAKNVWQLSAIAKRCDGKDRATDSEVKDIVSYYLLINPLSRETIKGKLFEMLDKDSTALGSPDGRKALCKQLRISDNLLRLYVHQWHKRARESATIEPSLGEAKASDSVILGPQAEGNILP